jgi:uncharacterized protein (TIGR03086 family)
MSEIDLLSSVLTKTGDVIERVTPDQLDRPTPCPDYDVAGMVDHLVGWVRSFDAAANGRTYEGDPSAVRTGDDPAGQFRASADSLVAGWRQHGLDRTVSIAGGESPGEMAFNMTLMEYATHGWDLAVATGQPVLLSEDEARQVLARAEGTLPPQYRGGDMPFGEIVPVPDDAPAIDRMIGFMGRDPAAMR